MSLTNFLQELKRSGISLWLDGDFLKVQAPKGTLTKEIQDQLVTYKEDIIALFKDRSAGQEDALPQCIPDPEQRFHPFPLSDLQRGFYMADHPYMEFHVRPHYYTEKNVTDLDVERYERAWNKALERHRGAIVTVQPDGNLKGVEDVQPLQCKVIDLRGYSAEKVQKSLQDTRNEMQRSELSIQEWPWLDLRVSLWTEQGMIKARIHYNHNNFFWDGYGTHQLLQEVEQYYDNPNLELPPLSLSFRDAVLALEQMAESSLGKKAKRYWEDRLPTLPGPPPLPTIAGVDRRCRSRLNRRERVMDQKIWSSYKEKARSFGITTSNALFSTYAEIISAWSNSRHFALSNMMTRRLNIHPEIKEILGNFVSLYPLEIDYRTKNRFVDRARGIQEQVMKDARFLHWGGMQVMQAFNRQQNGFGQAPLPFVVGSGLFMKDFKRADYSCLETSQVMLDHQFWELEGGDLYYVWDVLEEFFPNGMVDDMWEAYSLLIERLANDQSLWEQEILHVVPVSHIDERRSVLPHVEKLPEIRLERFLHSTANFCPDQKALITPTSTLSYEELEKESNPLAAILQDMKVGRGDVVAIATDRGPVLLKSVYAILKAGAAYVPIDPSLPYERREYILQNCEAKHVITEQKYLNLVQWPTDSVVISGDTCTITNNREVSYYEMEPADLAYMEPADLAYVIYTSGSTGRPKGVMLNHLGPVNTILDINERFQVDQADRIFGVSSFGFDLSVYDIFGAAASGAALVYPEPGNALNPSHWLECLIDHHVTIWNSAPPLAKLLVDAAEDRDLTFPDLRLVLLSGDWIPLDLPDRLRNIAPEAKIVSLGGATEASIWSIMYEIGEVQPSWKSIPYGYPMKNQSWYILDERGREVPKWTTGELYIGGVGLANGYWNDQEKTEASFILHPSTGERMYRTGDLGRYLPGGLIEFLGRKDSQVKIQGYRIELGEIETVLTSCPVISDAVVTVQKGVHSAIQLAAYIVPKESTTIGEDEVTELLRAKLPDYMIPKLMTFLETLPLSANGKVDRKALPKIEEQKVVHNKIEREPKDEIEVQLIKIWGTVLKHDHISVYDDFFELGGQSFEAVRMVGLIYDVFHLTISLGDIWQLRTIASLADVIRNASQDDQPNHIVEIKQHGNGTPLFMVHPAGGHVMCYRGLADEMDRPIYAFQAPGVNGQTQPLQSIPEFAEVYATSIHDIQPEGSVLLGGWSSGGLIAYELAYQLRKQGYVVEGVIIIDSPAPLIHESITEEVLFDWFVSDLNLDPAVYEELKKIERSAFSTSENVKRIAELIMTDARQLEAIYEVFKGIVIGSRMYRAPKIDVDLLVIRAQDGVVSEFEHHPYSDEVHWGWNTLTSGHVNGDFLPGTHYTLLHQPQLKRVVQCMNQWIAKKADFRIYHPV